MPKSKIGRFLFAILFAANVHLIFDPSPVALGSVVLLTAEIVRIISFGFSVFFILTMVFDA